MTRDSTTSRVDFPVRSDTADDNDSMSHRASSAAITAFNRDDSTERIDESMPIIVLGDRQPRSFRTNERTNVSIVSTSETVNRAPSNSSSDSCTSSADRSLICLAHRGVAVVSTPAIDMSGWETSCRYRC